MVASSTSTVVIFLGTSVGPIIGGQITEAVGLKWIFIVPGIACGAMGLLGMSFLEETYAPLLRHRLHRNRQGDVEQQEQPMGATLLLPKSQNLQQKKFLESLNRNRLKKSKIQPLYQQTSRF